MAKKKLLQDSEGQIWPITTADCVYLADGSKTVKKYIDDALAGKANSSHTHTVLSVKSDNWKDSTALPSTYDRGETLFFSNNPTSNKFNGLSYGMVQTLKEYGSGPAAWQFLYPYNAANDKFYVRNAQYNNDSWRNWAEVYTSLNKPTPADIGAQPSGRSINFIADHKQDWINATPMSGLTYAGGWHGTLGKNAYLSFANESPSYNLSMFIDGEYYAKENYKVYHEGNKPTAADVGAISLNGGTINGKLVFPQSDTHYIVNPSTPMQIGFGNVASYGNLRLFADTDGSSEDAEYVHIASGSSEPSIDSGLVVRKTFAMCNNVYMGCGNIILNNTNGLYGRVVDGTPKYLIKMTGSNIVDVGDTGTLTCLLSNTNPTWWNGAISVPLAHANTRLFEGDGYKFGYGIYGTSDAGFAGANAATVQGGASVWLKRNNYYDGTADRFVNGTSNATQLYLDTTNNKAQIRWNTNTPTANGGINWSYPEKLVSSVYNVTIHDAAPTNPGWGDVWVQI